MKWIALTMLAVLGLVGCDDDDGDDGGDDGGSATASADDDDDGGGETDGGDGDSMPTTSSDLMCGLYNTDDACTQCVEQNCCSQSEACAEDAKCHACYDLANAGDVLGEQAMGCFEHPPFAAVVDCVNDPGGCGPICSPPAGCGDYSCVTDSDCAAVGCSTCTVSGSCQ